MKHPIACLFALLLAGCATAPAPLPQATPLALGIPAGYALVWSDEFSADGLPDKSKWVYDTGMNKQGWHNRELQYYSGPRAENAEVRDGKLMITARKEQLPRCSGLGRPALHLVSNADAGQGRVDLWLLRGPRQAAVRQGHLAGDLDAESAIVWPAGGELDIAELVGREPDRVFSTVHTASGSGGKGSGAATEVPDACTAFHVYQMHWTPQQARFGIDGKTHFVHKNAGTGQGAVAVRHTAVPAPQHRRRRRLWRRCR